MKKREPPLSREKERVVEAGERIGAGHGDVGSDVDSGVGGERSTGGQGG